MHARRQPYKVKGIPTPDAPGSVLSLFSIPDSGIMNGTMSERVSEPNAAVYLGVTTRTLRNYRRSGKLAYREVPAKTRPSIEYEVDDLEKLRLELIARRTRSCKPKPIAAQVPRLTLSLPAAELDELRRDAERCGLSVQDYARRALREQLESQYKLTAAEIRTELQRCMTELRHVRADVAAGFESVLEFIGVPPDEAKSWVNENIR